MDKNLYLKLALTNIKKNKEIHFPYIIAITIIAIMYYSVIAMLYNKGLKDIPAGDTLNQCFMIADSVIRIIAFVFMLYINSFLIKKRLKEFGLYHILGLEKRHIIYVMVIENIIIFWGAIISGMILGTALAKFFFLILLKICHITESSSFIISLKPYISTFKLFGVIFVCCLIVNVITIIKNKTIDLLHRDKYGEKKMKGMVLFTFIGLIFLGGGYYIANAIENYVEAIQVFFPAVFMVIIATFLLFMSGSIALLSVLRKNKGFYYKTKNFISVSSLIYRMKQNAVGLANICILSTMAIVTAAGCVCLYTGQETIVKQMNRFDMTIRDQAHVFTEEVLEEIAKKNHVTIEDYIQFEQLQGVFKLENNEVFKITNVNSYETKGVTSFVAMSQDEYNQICQAKLELETGHIALASLEDMSGLKEGFYAKGKRYEVDKLIENDRLLSNKNGSIKEVIYIIFSNKEEAITFTNSIYQIPNKENNWRTNQYVNYEGEKNDRLSFANEIVRLSESKVQVDSIDTNRVEAYGFYGGILFIGIFFIIIFLTITILIIYFKQITEGYDDRERFVILQKVGMDGGMVRQAINRQILIVFFMPLITALLHLVFASNIIKSMMTAFYLVDYKLIFACIGSTSLVFAAIYIVVYKLTARVYFRIVKF